ncbi:hypothetical protein [Nostoc sphaeroides]|nr:hypothetical protein [Nostoc sphaeroides]
MVKPAILTVDDDPEVLQAVSRDLRHQYGPSEGLSTVSILLG